MGSKYLSYISDDDLIKCIDELYKKYVNNFVGKDLKELEKNIIDPFKFQFDTAFLNAGDGKKTIDNEIYRQSDKSIGNALGTFHQKLLGHIKGFEETPMMACDVKKSDNTIFAEVKNKWNTMNARSAEAVFDELKGLTSAFPKATCYLVEIIAKTSQDIEWKISAKGTTLANPRVRRISADKFYAIATGKKTAFKELCDVLPIAINDYLKTQKTTTPASKVDAYNTLAKEANANFTTVLKQVFDMSFKGYDGF